MVVFETGHFSASWKTIAERLGLRVDYVPGNWRRGASDVELESRLAADTAHDIKAVIVVHNETSTGVASRIADLRRAMNRTGHAALLIGVLSRAGVAIAMPEGGYSKKIKPQSPW